MRASVAQNCSNLSIVFSIVKFVLRLCEHQKTKLQNEITLAIKGKLVQLTKTEQHEHVDTIRDPSTLNELSFF